MPNCANVLVFDTGPLSHFARGGWLGALRMVAGPRTAVIPDTVIAELRTGTPGRPYLQLVLDAAWIQHEALTSDAELKEFAKFAELLAVGERNIGECGVLAYAKVRGATAVIDDGPPRKIAGAHNVKFTGTLGLFCQAIRDGQLTVEMVSTVADHLLESEYRLPFSAGGFREWANNQGIIPSDCR